MELLRLRIVTTSIQMDRFQLVLMECRRTYRLRIMAILIFRSGLTKHMNKKVLHQWEGSLLIVLSSLGRSLVLS